MTVSSPPDESDILAVARLLHQKGKPWKGDALGGYGTYTPANTRKIEVAGVSLFVLVETVNFDWGVTVIWEKEREPRCAWHSKASINGLWETMLHTKTEGLADLSELNAEDEHLAPR